MARGAAEFQYDPMKAPMRLKDAIEIAFPHGGMTVSGLRRERDRGNLAIERIAGREFTTLSAIEEMRRKCLGPQKDHGSTSSSQKDDLGSGTSETARINRERAALRETLRELKQSSSVTSGRSVSRGDRVIPLKSA